MSHADLIRTVISSSDSKTWRKARLEWFVKSMDEDESLESTCICGHEHLRYLFTIENRDNGNQLYPIGSKCIELFSSDRMNRDAKMQLAEWRLIRRIIRHAQICGKGDIIDFDSLRPSLSRKLLQHLYRRKVFNWLDYKFMLDMFNMRNEMTVRQERKYYAIAKESLYPYLRDVYRKSRTTKGTQ